MQPEKLAHHPFDTVARHRVSHLPAHGEAETDAAPRLASLEDEQDEAFGKVLFALLVTCRELGRNPQTALLVPS
jgi:hypothetical protein